MVTSKCTQGPIRTLNLKVLQLPKEATPAKLWTLPILLVLHEPAGVVRGCLSLHSSLASEARPNLVNLISQCSRADEVQQDLSVGRDLARVGSRSWNLADPLHQDLHAPREGGMGEGGQCGDL